MYTLSTVLFSKARVTKLLLVLGFERTTIIHRLAHARKQENRLERTVSRGSAKKIAKVTCTKAQIGYQAPPKFPPPPPPLLPP
jgi:hypothetical protein